MRDPEVIRKEVDALRNAAQKTHSAPVRGALMRRAAELEEAAQLSEYCAEEVIWLSDRLERL
jgi:hypothetical protein